jgi:hypothetical protein
MTLARADALGIAGVAVALLLLAANASAVSNETSNGCMGTQVDPCVRSGSCEIQGAVWTQDVTIDRAGIFDTQGWPGLCDMVHVGLVQGNCEPAGAQANVTVQLSASSFAWIPSITGPLECAGDPEPPPEPVPALSAAGRSIFGALLALLALGWARSRSA